MPLVVRGLVIAVVWLAATAFGLATSALRTEAGRTVIVEAATSAVNRAIQGTFTIDSVGGSFLSGLEVWDARIVDPQGAPFARVSRVRVGYNLRELLSRRLVLGRLTVDSIDVSLMQQERDGPLNVARIFGGGDTDSGGPRPFIAFRDVQIASANVVIRTPEDPAAAPSEGERIGTEYYRVRRITGIAAAFPYVRLSSPRAAERTMAFEIEQLQARMSDPAFTITSARGAAELWDDTLRLALSSASFPNSRGQVHGFLSWTDGPLLFDLLIATDGLLTDDVHGLASEVPVGLQGSGTVTVRSINAQVLAVDADGLDLSGRGRLRGRFAMTLGPGDRWRQRATDLTLTDFDLEYVRHLLDTMPVAGRLTGRVGLDGPRDSLRLTINATFRDSLVAGRPETYLRGRGIVALGVPGDFVFRNFLLDSADIDLRTVKRLIPAIDLVGRLRGAGTLEGAWLQASYRGRMRHQDAERPETVANGLFRVDATGPVVGIWADMALDSLRLAGLATSYPQLATATGVFGGRAEVAGYLDSIWVNVALTGPVGTLDVTGPFGFTDGRSGAHRFEATANQLDLAAFASELPSTRVSGTANGSGWQRPNDAELSVRSRLTRSVVRGVEIDSARGEVTFDTTVTLDGVEVWARGAYFAVTGVLGRDEARRGNAQFTLRVDSLATIEPWVSTALGPVEAADTVSGAFTVTGRLTGSLGAFVVLADIRGARVRRGSVFLSQLGASGTWASATQSLRLNGTVDSAQLGTLSLSAVTAAIDGQRDSLRWDARSRVGRGGTWQGAGQVRREGAATVIEADSLRLQLVTGQWSLNSAQIAVSDSAVVVRDFRLSSDAGAGRVSLNGRLPFLGPGALSGSVEALPIVDTWQLLGRDIREVSGEVSGTLSLLGTARAPIVEASIAVRDAVFGTFRGPQTAGVLRYRDQRVTGELELRRGGAPILTVDVDLPLDLSLVSVERRRLPGALRIQAQADDVDLSLFNAITPAVRRASGTFDADIGVAGSWADPELRGSIVIRNGAADFPSLGVRHDSIAGRFEAEGDTIHVRSLSLRSGGGRAQIGGYVRLDELTRPLLALQVRSQEFRAIDARGFLSLEATADLRLTGPVFGATLSGSATATQGVLYFADLVTKEIVNLEDTIFQGFVDTTLLRQERLGAAFENRFLDSLRIDSLRMAVGSDFWLRSSEANIQLLGAVQIDKRRQQYRLNGQLTTPRGSYRLLLPWAREFTVTRGEVRYLGTPDLNAEVSIEARHVVRVPSRRDVVVFVNIEGTVYEPQLRLSSDVTPPLTDNELMSLLLFGGVAVDAAQTRAAEVAALQASQILSGQVEALVISSLDVPLDYFQLRGAGSSGLASGAELALGKQFTVLGRTAFLTATPRVCLRLADQPWDIGGSLEFRFSRRWMLEASVEPRRRCDTFTTGATESFAYQFGLDLIWEMSY